MITRSHIISFCLCLATVLGFLAASGRFLHWFVLPTLLCGVLIGTDAVNWARGRLETFDPVGILGLLGVHFFFLAPLLNVYWDYWSLRHVTPPPDWRPWLGGVALLNLVGLLFYRAAKRLTWVDTRSHQTVWVLDKKAFAVILPIALVVTAATQTLVFIQQGGILGYIQSYEERGSYAFQGMGWVLMISESFPVLSLIGFAVYARNRPVGRSWAALIAAVVLFFALQILFGGLRGSRSNTIWALFWATGIVHLWVHPIPRRVIYVGVGFLLVFMQVYEFYKGAGIEGLKALQSAESRAELEARRLNGFQFVVLGDLARSDLQAFLLYRLSRPQDGFGYAWGRTYLGAIAQLIPTAIWADRPATKVREGTEAILGVGSYVPDQPPVSRVYGLAGETMLNFGPLAVPLAFAVLGLAVGHFRRLLASLHLEDSRRLICPLLVNWCVCILIGDSDNVLMFLIKNGAIPFGVLMASSRRARSGRSHV